MPTHGPHPGGRIVAFASINGITTLFLQSFINGVKKDITYKNLGDYPVIAGMRALYELEKSFKI